jgi:hypothetical protein
MADPPDDRFPTVPRRQLDAGSWEQTARREAVRFRLPTLTVREHTLVYEDATLPALTELDRSLRFFFASRLTFDPSLPPLTGPASMYPTVAREARRGFAEDLTDRGVVGLQSGRRERLRVSTGDRARLFPYRGRVRPPGSDEDVEVSAWLAVWTHDRTFYLAGGGYPERLPPRYRDAGTEGGTDSGAADRSGPAGQADPATYREELFELVREVR